MISSLARKLVLIGLLLLTLSFKVLADRSQSVPEQQYTMVRTHIAAFLARHGFQPEPAVSIGVLARSGECQLLIAEAAYQGWHRDSLRRLAAKEDRLLFFFRGRMYDDQPVWRTRLSGYWTSFLRNLGLNATVEPVLGIVASPACELKAMPWRELAGQVAALRR